MEEQTTYESGVSINKTLASTFLWMLLGVLSTCIIAAVTFYSGVIVEAMAALPIILVVQVAIALVMGFLINKMPVGLTTFLFFLYSMLTGVTFSILFIAFELNTIVYALFATAALYGVLAYAGYKTNMDLTNFGRVLFIALLIGLVLTVVNLFIGSSALDIAMDWVLLAVFSGLTVYDMNKVKKMAEAGVDPDRAAIYGAFQLYLDFVNIFIRILSIKSRN